MSNGEEDCCKVILVGEIAVGKTCIITQLMNKSFDQSLTTTLGASNSSIVLEIDQNYSEKFEIWDTSGQERYRALTKLYYKDASAVIMVYDITQKRTFTEIQNFWMQEVRSNGTEDVIIAIVANKSDLYEYEQVDEGDARKYAKSLGLLFHQTSAKNGEGIENLFREIGKKYFILKDKKKSMKNKGSKSVKVSQDIPEITEGKVKQRKCC